MIAMALAKDVTLGAAPKVRRKFSVICKTFDLNSLELRKHPIDKAELQYFAWNETSESTAQKYDSGLLSEWAGALGKRSCTY